MLASVVSTAEKVTLSATVSVTLNTIVPGAAPADPVTPSTRVAPSVSVTAEPPAGVRTTAFVVEGVSETVSPLTGSSPAVKTVTVTVVPIPPSGAATAGLGEVGGPAATTVDVDADGINVPKDTTAEAFTTTLSVVSVAVNVTSCPVAVSVVVNTAVPFARVTAELGVMLTVVEGDAANATVFPEMGAGSAD